MFHIQPILVSDSKDIQVFLNMQMFVEYKCLFQHPDLNWMGYIHGTPPLPYLLSPSPIPHGAKCQIRAHSCLRKFFPKFSGFENQTPILIPIPNPIRDRDSKSKRKTIPYRVSVGITGCRMIFREMELLSESRNCEKIFSGNFGNFKKGL